MDYKKYIDNIKDFPKEGIMFRDIQPLLANGKVFESAIDEMGNLIKERPKYWVGIESRGFIFATALAMRFGGGVRLIRKPDKLPNSSKMSIGYNLEYGNDILEIGFITVKSTLPSPPVYTSLNDLWSFEVSILFSKYLNVLGA